MRHRNIAAVTDERLTYSVDECCSVVGLGRTKVYELIKKGDLKTVKIGKRRLITKASTVALVHGEAA